MAFCRTFLQRAAPSALAKSKLRSRLGDISLKGQCFPFRRELSFKFSQRSGVFERKTCCQTDQMSAARETQPVSSVAGRETIRPFQAFGGRFSQEPATLSPEFDHGYKNHKSKGGSGYLCMPAGILAFSLFSKKKDETQEALDKLKDVDEVEMFLRRAKLAESKRDWAEADEFYHQALALLSVKKQQKTWDEARVVQSQVYIYDNMANLALSRGRLKEAELLYKETVKGLLNSGKEKNDNAIVEISLKLAMIYAMQQRDADAEAGYEFCMSTQDSKIAAMKEVDDDSLALYGMCINSYSRFLIIHDRLQEAEDALKKTIDIAQCALGKDHEQLAVLYSDLATVASMQQKHQAAKKYIDSAIDIGQKTNSPDLATFLCNKGLICIETKEFATAEKCCNKALKLAKERKDGDTESEAELCLKDIKEKRKKA